MSKQTIGATLYKRVAERAAVCQVLWFGRSGPTRSPVHSTGKRCDAASISHKRKKEEAPSIGASWLLRMAVAAGAVAAADQVVAGTVVVPLVRLLHLLDAAAAWVMELAGVGVDDIIPA